jgi:L-fuconolactonase
MRIDAHQHFWEYDPARQDWIDDSMKSIRRDFKPGDLQPYLEEFGFDGCVAVQAEESLRETDYLLDLADQNNWIKGVVGWTDIGSSKLSQVLEQYHGNKKLKGFREILQAKPPQYMLRENFLRGLKSLQEKGYTYDILVYPWHLSAVLELVTKCEEHALVIDHLAKPLIKDGEWKEWKKNLQPIAEREFVYAKISGLATEADWNNWSEKTLIPYIEIALELFGPKRLMFGSDWPVSQLAGSYEKILQAVENFTDSLSSEEKSWVMGKTATEFYKLEK